MASDRRIAAMSLDQRANDLCKEATDQFASRLKWMQRMSSRHLHEIGTDPQLGAELKERMIDVAKDLRLALADVQHLGCFELSADGIAVSKEIDNFTKCRTASAATPVSYTHLTLPTKA